MHVMEEPFVTRDGILRVMRPMEPISDRPLATLRRNKAASSGVRIDMRTASGQFLGRLQIYSSLNRDAARAYRRHRLDLARELAHRAAGIEASEPSEQVRRVISSYASRLPSSLFEDERTPALRRYVDMRRRNSWRGPDASPFLGEWVAQSGAWLVDRRDELAEALVEIDRQAAQARADLIPATEAIVRTFFGLVARMDQFQAELDGADGQVFSVARDRLESEGLASIGQPVAVVEELVPGGAYSSLTSAVVLDAPQTGTSPYEVELPSTGSFLGADLSARDREWLRRSLDRPPQSVPLAPLRVA